MKLLAIDPGPTESAAVLLDTDTGRPDHFEKGSNRTLLEALRVTTAADLLAVEMIASYGMPVGAEVFETCVMIGRFVEAWGGDDFRLIPRAEVKLHLTGQRRAKDANVRQALIDRYGPGKDVAIGRKATPGPLYGLTGDCWSALAVAITAAETSIVAGEARTITIAQ